MKKVFVVILVFVSIASIIFQGCSLPDKPYLKKDASETTPLKVQRTKTPDYRIYSTMDVSTREKLVHNFGLAGLAIGYATHHAATTQYEKPEVPDYGKLVMDKFVERASKEIPKWPPMTIENNPVNTESSGDKNFYIIEIQVNDIGIKRDAGFHAQTNIVMKDKTNNVIWEKVYRYVPNLLSRATNYELLKANNFELLKEEIDFAAEVTVTDFIIHFKNSRHSTEQR